MATNVQRSILFPLIVLTVIGLDFILARHVWEIFWIRAAGRYLIAFVALAAFIKMKNPDELLFGMKLKPRQGWGYWLKLGIVSLFFIGILVLVVWGIMRSTGYAPLDIFWKFDSSGRFWKWWLPTACFVIPILEELIYRLFLVSVLRLYFKPSLTVLIAGTIFGLLHVAYGAAAPENIIGGFLLTWVFLKSESITVPIVFHIGGNLAAGLTHYPFSH
jgi:membrane protease YdiL (CAAX protease family)